MTALILILSALVPALFYAALLYAFDMHEREPLWALSLLFVAGAACVPLALWLEQWADAQLGFLAPMRAGEQGAMLLGCFGVIAPVEELLKLGAVAVLARRKLMDEPVDGVVYAGVAALGFAAAEGVFAALDANPATMLMRALLAMPGHLCFSALWGAGLGALRYWGRPMLPSALASLMAALFAHGAYDYLLLVDHGTRRGAVVALLAVSAVLTALAFRGLLRASPFRGLPQRPGRCPACERRFLTRARFCAGCGRALYSVALPPVPIAFAPTLIAFVASGTMLVSASALCAHGFTQDAPTFWASAMVGASSQTAWAYVLVSLAAASSGFSARKSTGATQVLEALMATALVALCGLLWLTLMHPGHVLRALWLLPLALVITWWSARLRE